MPRLRLRNRRHEHVFRVVEPAQLARDSAQQLPKLPLVLLERLPSPAPPRNEGLSLAAKEMSELRSFSRRARITPTSFVNDYPFGSFKGDENAWMETYFDAYLHLANWGTHVLKLRLPSRLLDATTAKTYCGGDSAFVRERAGKASPPIGDTGLDREDSRAWVGKLPAKAKDEPIANLVVDADHAPIAVLRQTQAKKPSFIERLRKAGL